jgi:diguanylate cyclase (GGDEF)-like protein/PAS domain S-box-containing protein
MWTSRRLIGPTSSKYSTIQKNRFNLTEFAVYYKCSGNICPLSMWASADRFDQRALPIQFPLAENETRRLAALHEYLVVDVLSNPVFVRLAGMTARLFGTSMAAISIIGEDDQLIKAAYGLEVCQIPREHSFCTYTILSDKALVVADALEDPRFRRNPMVVNQPGIRFYAGVSLETPDGYNFGTLCVMDIAPRHLNEGQAEVLHDVAGMVMSELDLRLSMARTLVAENDRHGELHYRELFENADDIVFTHDLKGNFTSVNKAIQRITGYSREDALKMNIYDLTGQEGRQVIREMLHKKLGGSQKTTYEMRIAGKGGQSVTLEISARLLFRQGHPVGVQGIARDITERKRAEGHLQLLRSVVVNTSDAVLVAEADPQDPWGSRIVYVNEAFGNITGYSAQEVIGKTPRLLQGPLTDGNALEGLRTAISTSAPGRAELMSYRKDRSAFWAEMNVVPILDEKGSFSYWVSVFRDMTSRKRGELLERDRNQVLELVAGNSPLETVLVELAKLVERQYLGLACSVLLVRNGRFYHGAAPNLPKGCTEVFHGKELNPLGGPCARACLSKNVVTADVAAEPSLQAHRDLLLASGYRSCWAVPILSGGGVILGTFVAFSRSESEPDTDEISLLRMVSRLAAVAIEQRQLTDQLAYQALHDALTGLPNRILFEDHLQQALARAHQHGWLVGVLFIDLDRFKQINDTLGHAVGDSLLQQVCRRFERCLRRTDVLARMGGDEFTLVLSDLTDPEDALNVAQKLLDALKDPFKVEAYELFVTASIGISLFPRDGKDAMALQRSADSAMYRAKTHGKNSYEFFTPDLGAAVLEQLEIETALRRALDNGELQLYYQPQLDMQKKLAGLEALLVWNHPKLGTLRPAQFIPVAEDSGLIVPIGGWVLREACRQNAAWKKAGLRVAKVAINVSPMQFARADFAEAVREALAESALDPSLLELELTESVVMRDIDESARQLERLRVLGVGIAIDDFGTGYSSLSYLRRLPVDALKIDQSFLKAVESDATTMSLVQAIVSVAHSLGLCVIAEGVETELQLEALRQVGCDKVQGYLFGRPVPAEAAESLLGKWQHAPSGKVLPYRRDPPGQFGLS